MAKKIGTKKMEILTLEAWGRSAAPPEVLWSLLEDVACYPEWGPWTNGGYDRPGDVTPHGPGAIRRLRSSRFTTAVERIEEVEPGRRIAYSLVSGIPVKHYTAVVELTPDGTGTAVHWSARFDRTFGGRLVHAKMQRVYDLIMARLLAAASDARATQSEAS